MSYLSPSVQASLIADPTGIASLYGSIWRQFATDLGPTDSGLWMSYGLLGTAFACVVANDLKPYGTETNATYSAADLLASPALACDGFAALTWHFINLIPACASIKVRMTGWDNSAEAEDPACPVGNHVQMFAGDGTDWLMLDPTIGMVVKGKYRDVAAGIPISMGASSCFALHYQTDATKTAFAPTVSAALSSGLYRPCHALYYFAKLQRYIDFVTTQPISTWPTPSAARFQV